MIHLIGNNILLFIIICKWGERGGNELVLFRYNDSNRWSPDQVNAFQDAMYKTEKDFHLIAQEVREEEKEWRGQRWV